ncbi:MAG: hypothetical protein IMZ61_14420 [Planctomycetes bacterium]|nr:hypothetical protein [Planctomycetota bacterium]
MKIIIIKAIIGWLWKNHEKIFRATMKEIGHHAHKNPPKKIDNIEVVKAVQEVLGG